MTTRAGIYTRVSSEEQAAGGTSLELQVERCRAYVQAQGWTLADEYVDAGVSGAKASRPALDQLMADVRAGGIDTVIVSKLDRLGRSTAHLAPLLAELDERRVGFVSLAEQWDTSTPTGRFVRGMFSQIAELERGMIRERTRAGVAKRVEAGGWSGGHKAPYGYAVDRTGTMPVLVVDDREAGMIRLAVELAVDHGLTCGQIADRLNALGFVPRDAPLWTSQNLRNALRRGQWDGSWTFAKPAARVSYHSPITISIPPILSAERAEALRAHLSATTLRRGAKGVHPLSSRLHCPCGAAMTGLARSDRSHRRYRCRFGRHEPGRPFCGLPSLLADRVDDAVWAEVVRLLADPAALAAAAREHLGLLEGAARVEADALGEAEAAVERMQRALAEAGTRCLALGFDAETTARTVAGVQQQYAAAVAHRGMVLAARTATTEREDRLSKVQRLAELARERLEHADRELQARVFALLDVRVTVLEHGGKGQPTRLRVEGSVVHDLLLTAAERDWTPVVRASAAG